jgi:hypothetical protein
MILPTGVTSKMRRFSSSATAANARDEGGRVIMEAVFAEKAQRA